jgi:hypothetical protein
MFYFHFTIHVIADTFVPDEELRGGGQRRAPIELGGRVSLKGTRNRRDNTRKRSEVLPAQGERANGLGDDLKVLQLWKKRSHYLL